MNDVSRENHVRRIVIAGHGPEAAAAAAGLAVALRGTGVQIALVASVDGHSSAGIGKIRGGAQAFHRQLGIDEQLLIKETAGCYSLGSQFKEFATHSETVFVPHGRHGRTMRLVPFHHFWCKLRAAGSLDEYNEYSLAAAAASFGRFTGPAAENDAVLATLDYHIVVDSDLYTIFFRKFAQDAGVRLVDGNVTAAVAITDGFIEKLQLESGEFVEGDFFIDCTNSRQLISTLDNSAEFDNWSDWQPCDRMISLLTRKQKEPTLFTEFHAIDTGWLQRNALQNFTVESLAFNSSNIDDPDARSILEKNLKHAPVGKPDFTPIVAGSWHRPWLGNCVAIGPAALKFEPTVVSPLQVAQNAILRLLGMLPASGREQSLASEFNRTTAEEHAAIRDFAALHYYLADRPAGEFWAATRTKPLPESLQRRIDLFKAGGRVGHGENEEFTKSEWVSSLINFGLLPAAYAPLADMADEDQVLAEMQGFRAAVAARAKLLAAPAHTGS